MSWCWCRRSCTALVQTSARLPDSRGPRNAEESIDSGYTRSTMWRSGFPGEQNRARPVDPLSFRVRKVSGHFRLLLHPTSRWLAVAETQRGRWSSETLNARFQRPNCQKRDPLSTENCGQRV